MKVVNFPLMPRSLVDAAPGEYVRQIFWFSTFTCARFYFGRGKPCPILVRHQSRCSFSRSRWCSEQVYLVSLLAPHLNASIVFVVYTKIYFQFAVSTDRVSVVSNLSSFFPFVPPQPGMSDRLTWGIREGTCGPSWACTLLLPVDGSTTRWLEYVRIDDLVSAGELESSLVSMRLISILLPCL